MANVSKEPLPQLSFIGKRMAQTDPKSLMLTEHDDIETADHSGDKRRGQPRDFDTYIKESEEQIKKWTEELKGMKLAYGTKGKVRKQKDMLRNKISALRCRIKRKVEERESKRNLTSCSTKFNQLMEIIESELKDPEASKFYKKIVARIDKSLGKKDEGGETNLL